MGRQTSGSSTKMG